MSLFTEQIGLESPELSLHFLHVLHLFGDNLFDNLFVIFGIGVVTLTGQGQDYGVNHSAGGLSEPLEFAGITGGAEVGGLISPKVNEVAVIFRDGRFFHLLRWVCSNFLLSFNHALDEHFLVRGLLQVLLRLKAICPKLVSLGLYSNCLFGNLEEGRVGELCLLCGNLSIPTLVLECLLELFAVDGLAPDLLSSHI